MNSTSARVSQGKWRYLVVYPECAAMQDRAVRQECCDQVVKSSAGRDFCYNEVIHEEGEFDQCSSFDEVIDIFDCCEKLKPEDPYYTHDCQSELTKNGCDEKDVTLNVAKELCDANFLEAQSTYLEHLEQQRAKALSKASDDSDSGLELWEILVFFVGLPIFAIVGLIVAMWAIQTKCGKKSCRKAKDQNKTNKSSVVPVKEANNTTTTTNMAGVDQSKYSSSTTDASMIQLQVTDTKNTKDLKASDLQQGESNINLKDRKTSLLGEQPLQQSKGTAAETVTADSEKLSSLTPNQDGNARRLKEVKVENDVTLEDLTVEKVDPSENQMKKKTLRRKETISEALDRLENEMYL